MYCPLMKKSQGRFRKQKLAHANIKKKTDADKISDQGRPAVTKKGQGDAHNWQHTGDHGNIYEHLPKDHRCQADCQEIAKAFPAGTGDLQTPENNQHIKRN